MVLISIKWLYIVFQIMNLTWNNSTFSQIKLLNKNLKTNKTNFFCCSDGWVSKLLSVLKFDPNFIRMKFPFKDLNKHDNKKKINFTYRTLVKSLGVCLSSCLSDCFSLSYLWRLYFTRNQSIFCDKFHLFTSNEVDYNM